MKQNKRDRTKPPPGAGPEGLRYESLLSQLDRAAPRVADALARAQSNRTRELNRYLNGDTLRRHFPGAYVAGLDEILSAIDTLCGAYAGSATLGEIAFLLTRAYADFQSAIDAALTGFNGVVLDTMRDVMEVEYLLRDFQQDPARMKEWLRADRNTLLREFAPKTLRQRQLRALGTLPENLPDAFEYRLHSEGLHVSPSFILNDLAGKGFAAAPAPRATEFAFAEIFEHARRLLIAAYDLGARVEGPNWSSPDVRTTMPEAMKAWERTKIIMAAIAGHAGPNRGT